MKNVVSYFYVLLIASFVEGTTKTEFTDHNLKLKYLNLYENYWCQGLILLMLPMIVTHTIIVSAHFPHELNQPIKNQS